jgi:hypothetical protein
MYVLLFICHVCRLSTTTVRGKLSADELATYLSSPSARKDLSPPEGKSAVLKGITPNYQALSEWLSKNECGSAAYEAVYGAAIYQLS